MFTRCVSRRLRNNYWANGECTTLVIWKEDPHTLICVHVNPFFAESLKLHHSFPNCCYVINDKVVINNILSSHQALKLLILIMQTYNLHPKASYLVERYESGKEQNKCLWCQTISFVPLWTNSADIRDHYILHILVSMLLTQPLL